VNVDQVNQALLSGTLDLPGLFPRLEALASPSRNSAVPGPWRRTVSRLAPSSHVDPAGTQVRTK